MDNFNEDRPFYDMTIYEYEAQKTNIMTQADFCRFVALTYIRLRLLDDFHQGLFDFNDDDLDRVPNKRPATAMDS